jgi:anti-sigma factor RsiW
MTDKNQKGAETAENLGSLPPRDEELAAVVSAYLDGALDEKALAEFEALLQSDEGLEREVAQMRLIDDCLTGIGAGILSEPVPESLLSPLSRLTRKDR